MPTLSTAKAWHTRGDSFRHRLVPFMRRSRTYFARFVAAMLALVVAPLAGCGTTRSTDTGRTATEQLLISDAIDRAVQTVDFGTLKGQTVYLDDSHLGEAVDRHYLVSTLRQHLLASGCSLRDKADDAEFIVEARAGAIGTDRNDLLFGVPSMNVPQIMPAQPTPAAIPEIPVAKRRDQRGVAKIAVFAYHRKTGAPVWQSGLAQMESSSNDVWILGAGPFQRGTIYEGTTFAGQAIGTAADTKAMPEAKRASIALGDERRFSAPDRLVAVGQSAGGETPAVASSAVPNPMAEAVAPPSVAAVESLGNNATSSAPNAAYSQLFAPRPSYTGEGLTAQVHEERRLKSASSNRYDTAQ